MKIKFVVLLFFFLCFAAPASQSAYTKNVQNNAPLKQGKQLKYGYGIISTESNRKHREKKYGRLHEVVHYVAVSQKGKAITGGANDLRRPRSKNSSTSLQLKPKFFLPVGLRHIAIGFLICVLFLK